MQITPAPAAPAKGEDHGDRHAADLRPLPVDGADEWLVAGCAGRELNTSGHRLPDSFSGQEPRRLCTTTMRSSTCSTTTSPTWKSVQREEITFEGWLEEMISWGRFYEEENEDAR